MLLWEMSLSGVAGFTRRVEQKEKCGGVPLDERSSTNLSILPIFRVKFQFTIFIEVLTIISLPLRQVEKVFQVRGDDDLRTPVSGPTFGGVVVSAGVELGPAGGG